MKRLMIALLAVGLFSQAAMAQLFIIEDGTFQAQLLDRTVDESGYVVDDASCTVWQTYDSLRAEDVSVVEFVYTYPVKNRQAELDSVRTGALMAGGKLLSDKNGVFNGHHGKQFTVAMVTNHGVHLTFTTRAWVNKAGTHIYTISVYELSKNIPALNNRVNYFLNSAKVLSY